MKSVLWDNLFKKQDHSILETLKKCPIFSSLKERELLHIEKMTHQRLYAPGELVFKAGSGTGMYIVVKGKIDILYDSTKSEGQTLVSRIEESEFFGELNLVRENSYPHFVGQAVEDSLLLGFFKSDLLELCEGSPNTGAKILTELASILGKRLEKASEKIYELSKESSNS